jgi:carbon monoxide dehydrogenase subunit G
MTGRTRARLVVRTLLAIASLVIASLAMATAMSTAMSTVASDGAESPIDVHVSRADKTVSVRVSFLVDVTPDQAWSVLTDYENMPRFLPNLHWSSVLNRRGNTLEVAQKGQVSHGLLKIDFDNVREVVLTPKHEIRSRMIHGDMKSSVFVTRIAAEGEHTRVTYEGEFIPNMWVPPVVGPSMVESETRKQWQQIRAEMQRRAHGAPAARGALPAQ